MTDRYDELALHPPVPAPSNPLLTKQEYSTLKRNLTRAQRSSDDPVVVAEKVYEAVKAAVKLFDERVWPDDWPRWRIALDDAATRLRFHDTRELAEKLRGASYAWFR